MTELLLWTLVTGVLSALATGLGALPVAALPTNSDWIKAMSSAVAAGMMMAAAVFSLTEKALAIAPYQALTGFLLGAAFLHLMESRPHQESSKGMLLVAAMFVHSIPEGVAIGVGFATGDLEFGLLMALAISIHNIPEGVAISLPLRAEGASLARCAGYSILSSVPQPIAAVPAAIFAAKFSAFLPIGLGFAGGAMIYLAAAELIPDAVEAGGRTTAGWGTCLGLTGMLAVSLVLEGLF